MFCWINGKDPRQYGLDFGLWTRNIVADLIAPLFNDNQIKLGDDPTTGVSHLVNIETPQDQMQSVNALQTIPVGNTTGIGPATQPEIVGGLSNLSMTATPGVVSHYAIMPAIDIYATVAGRDLGGTTRAMQATIDDMQSDLPRGATVALTGQASTAAGRLPSQAWQ